MDVWTMIVSLAALAGSASQPGGPTQPSSQPAAVRPEVPPDPEVARILGALGAGESALLPPAKVTGDLNDVAKRYSLDKKGPGGRNYCVEMVWMADRRRAIYCGANHGSPHRLNDVWEYDLAGNTWVCLYGPDDLRPGSEAFAKATFRDGAFVTPRGGPVVMGHLWGQLTYDPTTGTMYYNSQWPMGYFPKDIQEKYKGAENRHHPPLWSFRPAEGKWRPVFAAAKPIPAADILNTAQNRYLQFVPQLGGLLFVDADDGMGTWLFNPRTRLWKELLPGEAAGKKAKTNPNLPFRVGMKAYCPDRGLLVIASQAQGRPNRTVVYDVAQNAWAQTAEGPEVPGGHPSFTPGGYDPASGVFLLYDQRKESRGLWAYDMAAKRWSRVTPTGPQPPEGAKLIGYFDPVRNVFVLIQNTTVWVYRPTARKTSPTVTRPAAGS